jgi:hypothetical protein
MLKKLCVHFILLTASLFSAIPKGQADIKVINLSHCSNFTAHGLEGLVKAFPRLYHLNVDGCKQIDLEDLHTIAPYMPYSSLSSSFFGFQALDDVEALIKDAEYRAMANPSAIKIQKVARGRNARTRKVQRRRQDRLVLVSILKLQARVRSRRQVEVYAGLKRSLEIESAINSIINLWRAMKFRRKFSEQKMYSRQALAYSIASGKIQRVYRGFSSGRQLAKNVRQQNTERCYQQDRKTVLEEMSVLRLQRFARCCIAIKEACVNAIERRRYIQSLAIDGKSASKLQSWWRAHAAQKVARKMKEEVDTTLIRLNLAQLVQKAQRQQKARKLCNQERCIEKELSNNRSASSIQAFWLKQTTFKQIRQAKIREASKQCSSLLIQRVWHGYTGREKRRLLLNYNDTVSNATLIQSAVRCFIAREEVATKEAMFSMEHTTVLMCNALDADTKKVHDLLVQVSQSQRRRDESKNVVLEYSKEVALIEGSKTLYWDSDKIAGMTQRYKSSLLSRELKKMVESHYKVAEKEALIVEQTQEEISKLERRIQNRREEMEAAQERLEIRTRQSLREQRKHVLWRKHEMAILIQKMYRGHLSFAAFDLLWWEHERWEEEYSIATGATIFLDTITGQAYPTRPLVLDLSKILRSNMARYRST